MSENGEIYTAGKNFTLPPALTALTNSTSESRLHTFSHSALDNLCTRGNGVNPVNTLIQHKIQLEKKYTTFGRDGSNISYVANLWVPFDSAC